MPDDARHLHTIGRRADASQPRPRPRACRRVRRLGGSAVLALAVVAALALAVRVALAATAVLWFDEATAGRMAMDTLAGRFPFFLYGQTFMGAIEGYLDAVPFAALGPSSGAMRVWPVLLSLVQVGVASRLARAILGQGRWAALVALGSSAFGLKWAHDARLTYDLVPLLTPLLLLLALRALDPAGTPPARTRAWLVLTLVGGLAWWVNLLHALPLAAIGLGVVLVRPSWSRGAWLGLLAFAAGSAPSWLFLAWRGRPAASHVPIAAPAALLTHARDLVGTALPIVMGVPESARHGPAGRGGAAAAVAVLAAAAVATLADRRADPRGRLLLGLTLALSLAAVVGTERGVSLATEDPRYLLPVAGILPVLLAGLLGRVARGRPRVAVGAAAVVLGLQAVGIAAEYPALVSPAAWRARRAHQAAIQAVADQLARAGRVAVYTHDPDVLTFASGGRVAVAHLYLEADPRLARRVDGARQVAYLAAGPPPGFEASLGAAGIGFARQPTPRGTLYTDFVLAGDAGEEIPADGWEVTASARPERASHAIDRDAATAWDTGRPRSDGAWFQVDLGRPHRVTAVSWLPRGYQEVPTGFRVETSLDGRRWAVAQEASPYYGPLYWSGGHPMGRVRLGRVEARFAPRPARYLRLVHLGADPRLRWSIRELFVYAGRAATPAHEVPADAAAALRAAGVQRLYADHALAARLAEAAGGALLTPPANVSVDLYGAVPPIDTVPPFRPAPDAAIALGAGAPEAPAIEAILREAGIGFAVRQAGGYRLLEAFAPAPPPASAAPPPGAVLTASSGDAAAAADGRLDTRWGTGVPQRAGQWLRLDLPAPLVLAGLDLELGRFRSDYPRGLRVELGDAQGGWSVPAATVLRPGPLAWLGTHLARLGVDRVVVTFPPARVRAVRLVQTGQDGVFDWSVAELRLRTP